MKVYLIIVIVVLFAGCKKPENRSCWKFAGKDSSKTIPLNEFDLLFLDAHLEYVLVQDTVNFVVIEGHENLINLVETEISAGKLSIRNTNKCNFLRNYKTKKILVTLHFKNIVDLAYQGTENLSSQGTLNLPNFSFSITDGAGPITMDIKSNRLVGVITHGYGDFTLSGEAKYANFIVSSNGYCNTNYLNIIDSIDVVSRTTATCKYNFSNSKAKVEIQNSGNIEYIGLPAAIETNLYGSGQLIDNN